MCKGNIAVSVFVDWLSLSNLMMRRASLSSLYRQAVDLKPDNIRDMDPIWLLTLLNQCYALFKSILDICQQAPATMLIESRIRSVVVNL